MKVAFESLTPGRQRANILHFSAARQSKTREARVKKCIPQILIGKGLNDCYIERENQLIEFQDIICFSGEYQKINIFLFQMNMENQLKLLDKKQEILMRKSRKNYGPEEKGGIIKRHMLEGEAISKICEELNF